MKKQRCLITDIIDAIKEGKEKITELQTEECELPSESVMEEVGSLRIDAAVTNLPAN